MKKYVLLVCAVLFPIGAAAQAPGLGFPPYGSFNKGQFDAVNLQNLNALFSIPIASSSARGMATKINITNNGAFWYSNGYWTVGPTQSVLLGSTQPLYGWDFGWGQNWVSYSTELVTCDLDSQNSAHWFDFYYAEADGTTHTFSGAEVYGSPTACNFPTSPINAYADDGSGYYVIAQPYYPTVYAPSGAKISTNDGRTWTIYDTNGNHGGQYVDAIGRTIVSISNDSSHYYYAVKDSNGNSQTFTLTFQSFNVKTNFGCYPVQEYSAQNQLLPVSLTLPNGRSYSFTYEATPGWPGWTTARVNRVTLPTGGYYEYNYPATGTANGGMSCIQNSYGIGYPVLASVTQTISDGTVRQTWSYTMVPVDGCFGLPSSCIHYVWKTKVTPPQLPYDSAPNESTWTFTQYSTYHPGLWGEVLENHYRGLESSGQLLRSSNTIKSDLKRPVSVTTTLENNLQTKVEIDWNADNQVTEQREYDWGNGAGPLLRRTTYTYLSTAPYTNHLIRDRVIQKIVKDGNGNIKSRTDIAYDESGKINTSCPAGIPGHDDISYGCTFTTRGNPTSVTVYTDAATPSGSITHGFTYDWFGNVLTTQVNSVVQKQLNFSSVTQYSLPDSVVSGPSGGPQLTTSATYSPYTSVVTTSTNENGQVTTFTYADPGHMNRLTDVQRPDSQHVTYAYDDIARTVAVTSPVQSGTSIKQVSYFDGLGRKVKQQVTDGAGTSYSILETQFDSIGRAYKTSNPHNSTAQYWTEVRFDGLGRLTVSIPPGGTATSNNTSYAYSGATVTVTDPAGKQKKSQSDGLDRLTALYEPDVANGNQLTQQTSYTYSVLDRLTQVSQGAQTRTYTYDGLGRLLTVQVPETNQTQTTYTYNNFNLITQRTDARGVITTYSYDTLNRMYNVSYNVGSTGVPATPTVTSTFGTNSGQNNNGRLISITDGVGSENYTYDILGRVTQLQKVIGTTTYTTQYAYNYASELGSTTYPSGRVVQPNYDAIGRLCSVGLARSTCSTGTTYAAAFAYNAANQLTGFNYGNGVTASFGYSPDRLQLTSLSYVKSPTTLFSLSYGYTQNGGNNGQITNMTDNTGTQEAGRSATYTYDALYRLSSAVTTGSASYPQWGLSWTYDRYSNRTAQSISSGCVAPMTCPTNSLGIDANTNRISGDCYDQNGSLLAESAPPCPSPTYSYDGENRLVNFSTSAAYTYDGNGLRVKKCLPNCTSPTSSTVYIFSGSKVIAEYDNAAAVGSPSREYVYSGGALLAKIDSSGTKYYHQDHLSNRLVTDSSGNTFAQFGTFPFGESWYNASNDKLLFTTYERDSESGNDYAMARYHISRLGRFSSVDPLAGSSSNPQSLNRYAYASNNPTNLTDPSGLCDDNCKERDLGTEYDGSGGGHCALDNIDAECNVVFALIRQGSAARCPNNDCTNLQLKAEGWKKWAFEGFIRAVNDCYDSFDNCRLVSFKQSWRSLLIDAGPVANDDPFMDPNSLAYGVFMTSQSQKIWNGATNMVNAGAIYTGVGIGIVVAAPVAVPAATGALDTAKEMIVVGFADNPRAWQGTMDVVKGLFQPNSQPTTPEGLVMRLIMGYWLGKP